jgi:hypothetical protein
MTNSEVFAGAGPARRSTISPHAYPERACRRLEGFSKPLSVLLIIYALVAVLAGLVSAYGIVDTRMFSEEAIANADIDADSTMIMAAVVFSLLAVLERLVFFICVFFVGRFTYRAMRNLYTVGSMVPEKSPAGTIYWYVVPFANFVVPASAMSEIYRGSIEETGRVHKSNLVGYWWTAWLVSLAAAIVSNSRYTPIDVLGIAVTISLLFSGLAALLLRVLIQRIAAAQQVIMQTGAAQIFA